MANNIRNLSGVPIAHVEQQYRAKPCEALPMGEIKELEDIKRLKRVDNRSLSLVEEETSAIFLRQNDQHLIYPPHFTKAQKKVLEQCKLTLVEPSTLSSYICIRSRICALLKYDLRFTYATSTHSNDDKTLGSKQMIVQPYIIGAMARFFENFEAYLCFNNKKAFQHAKETIIDASAHASQSVCTNINMPGSKQTLELVQLLEFIRDCLNNPKELMPYLLLPCRSFPCIPVEQKRIRRLYLDTAKSVTLGVEVFIHELQHRTKELCEIPIKSKESNNSNQNANQVLTNKITNFVKATTEKLHTWQKNSSFIHNEQNAEIWSNLCIRAGIVPIKDISQHTAISTNEMIEDALAFEAKIIEYHTTSTDIHSQIYGDFERTILPIKCHKGKPSDAVQLGSIFIHEVKEREYTFYKLVYLAVRSVKHYYENSKTLLTMIKPYIDNLRMNDYKSSISTSLDCIVHEFLKNMLQIEEHIKPASPCFQEKFNQTLEFFLQTMFLLNKVIRENLSQQALKDYMIEIKNKNEEAMSNLLGILKADIDSATKNSISIIVKYHFTLLLNLKIHLSCGWPDEMIRIPFIQLGKDNVCPSSEAGINDLFVQKCFEYTSWCLKHMDIDKYYSIIQKGVQNFISFVKWCSDDGYSNLAKDLGDLSYLEMGDLYECLSSIETSLYDLKTIVSDIRLFLEQPLTTWNEDKIQQWIKLLATLDEAYKRNPKYAFLKLVVGGNEKICGKKGTRIDLSPICAKSKKHDLFVRSFVAFADSIFEISHLVEHRLPANRAMILLINKTLYDHWKTKQNLRELEGSHQRQEKENKIVPEYQEEEFFAIQSDDDSDEEKGVQSKSTSSQVNPPTQTLTKRPFNVLMVPIIDLRSHLRGLIAASHRSKTTIFVQEQVSNALHYTAHISELLEEYGNHDKWNDTAILTFLSKCALLFEQTIKYGLKKLTDTSDKQAQESLQGHNIGVLWQEYETLVNDNSLALSDSDKNLLSDFSLLIPKLSRYPLMQVLSETLTPLMASISMKKGLNVNNKQEGQADQTTIGMYPKLRKAGMRLIELSLNVWQREAKDYFTGFSLELPSMPNQTKAAQNIKPELQKQWQVILEDYRKIKSNPGHASDIRRTQYQDSLRDIEGAILALHDLLPMGDIQAVPFSTADGILLHSSTLLEQASLALVSCLDIRDPLSEDQHILTAVVNNGTERWWKYSHNITEFLQIIEKATEPLGLTELQWKNVEEVTKFLAITNHYPAVEKGFICVEMDQLRKCCELKRKIITNQGFLSQDEAVWCQQKFGSNYDRWAEQIDNQIDFELNETIYQRALNTLVIAAIILKKISLVQ